MYIQIVVKIMHLTVHVEEAVRVEVLDKHKAPPSSGGISCNDNETLKIQVRLCLSIAKSLRTMDIDRVTLAVSCGV